MPGYRQKKKTPATGGFTSVSPTGDAPPRWNDEGAGERYRDRRFRSARAAGRDPRLVQRLLQRYAGGEKKLVLDVPAGAGRLRDVLTATGAKVVSVDNSWSMLAAAGPGTLRLRGDALRLPFRARSFELVVCCRLFHHLTDDGGRVRLLSELLRVASQRVLVSFWDAASWHALRRRHGLRRARHDDARLACSRSDMERLARLAGARVLGHAASLRFVSPQTFCALEPQA